MMRFFSEPKLLFQNDSIWKKHQKLLEQHRLEMEELQKKFLDHFKKLWGIQKKNEDLCPF